MHQFRRDRPGQQVRRHQQRGRPRLSLVVRHQYVSRRPCNWPSRPARRTRRRSSAPMVRCTRSTTPRSSAASRGRTVRPSRRAGRQLPSPSRTYRVPCRSRAYRPPPSPWPCSRRLAAFWRSRSWDDASWREASGPAVCPAGEQLLKRSIGPGGTHRLTDGFVLSTPAACLQGVGEPRREASCQGAG